jgi:uncharacterized protein YkwD
MNLLAGCALTRYYQIVNVSKLLRVANLVLLAAYPLILSPAKAQSALYQHGDPSVHEQAMLELVNAARANPLGEAARLGIDLNQGLTPGAIATNAKPPLAFHSQLITAARGHSDWMLLSGIFSHTGVDGTRPTERAQRAGYGFPAAENIAYRSTSGAPDYDFMTAAIHESLVRSPGHRRNIMAEDYAVVGLGLRPGTFGGQNAFMATQKFSSGGATLDSGPFILGVCYTDRNNNGAYDPGEGAAGVRVDTGWATHHAITSSSGGYAIPIVPIQTNTATVNLPFAVRTASWDTVQPYEVQYHAQQIAAAPLVTLSLQWSGGALGGTVPDAVTVRRPVRINYRLLGTDGWFYDRTMVTTQSVKRDLRVAPVVKTDQTVNFPQPAAQTFVLNRTFSLAATATSGLPVSYYSSNPAVLTMSGSTATIRGTGTAYVAAWHPGNQSWNAAPMVVRTITVLAAKTDQTVNFPQPASQTFVLNRTFSLAATATSGLPVSYYSSNPAVLTVSGSTATIRGMGTAYVAAWQLGSQSWNAAPMIVRTITVQ